MISTIAGAVRQKEIIKLRLISGCILLCLLTALPVTAQGVDMTCQSVDMAGYANAGFCLPTGVSVVQEDLAEANYTGGREIKALLLFDESEVYLHLLYPCTIRGISESEIKSQIEAYDPHIKTAGYGTPPISVNGLPAVWGRTGNWTFVAYQPVDNALALIYFEASLPVEIGASFLDSLNIDVNQTVSPLYSGYCSQTVLGQKADPAVANKDASTYSQNDIDYNQHYSQGPEAEARMVRFEATKERMTSDMEDTKERLEETKERLGGYGLIPNPFIHT